MIQTALYVLHLKNPGVMPGDWRKKSLYLYFKRRGGGDLEKYNAIRLILIPEKSVKLDHKNIAL